jgi:uncharacterized protein with PIN domain
MRTAHFLFFGELNDLLPPTRRFTPFEEQVDDHASLKHVIESFGIPHTEIGAIRMDGQATALANRVPDHSLIEIYPYHYLENDHRLACSLEPLEPLAPPGEPRFILDIHLGKLAVYLRILGFDSLYQNDFQDDTLAALAERFDRILLSKDRRLLMRKQVHYGYCVRSQDPARQTLEIIHRYQLYGQIRPLQRCLDCNTPLEPVDKREIIDRLELLTRRFYQEFHRCPNCDKIYWKGSHYDRMRKFIAWIEAQPEQD